ncbi:MAG: sulfatase-like hydrolase/transferase [Alphaproteobacteria bacterium]|nr:sulfatase-like hydrolase/transferase [Alphaproteobacteria bacterium]
MATTAVQWSRAPHEGPSFLYLHLNDAHAPYKGREPWYSPQADPRADLLATYDSGVSYVDLYLSRLEEALGWGEDTVLIVVSDHGEEFGEHGQQGHLFSLHRELSQVLMAVRAPGVEPGHYPDTVSLIDVLPTTLALAGLPPAEGVEGLSLAPVIRGVEGLPADRTVFSHRVNGEEALWSAQTGDWRVIESPEGATLYELSRDPGEQRAAEDPGRGKDLGEALAAFRARAGEVRSEMGRTELDAAELEALRSLGYVEEE